MRRCRISRLLSLALTYCTLQRIAASKHPKAMSGQSSDLAAPSLAPERQVSPREDDPRASPGQGGIGLALGVALHWPLGRPGERGEMRGESLGTAWAAPQVTGPIALPGWPCRHLDTEEGAGSSRVPPGPLPRRARATADG